VFTQESPSYRRNLKLSQSLENDFFIQEKCNRGSKDKYLANYENSEASLKKPQKIRCSLFLFTFKKFVQLAVGILLGVQNAFRYMIVEKAKAFDILEDIKVTREHLKNKISNHSQITVRFSPAVLLLSFHFSLGRLKPFYKFLAYGKLLGCLTRYSQCTFYFSLGNLIFCHERTKTTRYYTFFE
jgi:hypothetical protein